MSKKLRKARQKLAHTLVSFFVLLVFLFPIALTVRWVAGMAGERDPRKVVATAPFQVREIDSSDKPIVPFKEPLVSITFDDGWESVYSSAFPLLQKYGFYTTQYVMSGSFEDREYMSIDQMQAMNMAGHSIESHTATHANLTTLDEAGLHRELTESKQILSHYFDDVKDFTSPFGAYNQHVLAEIGKVYRSHKNAEGGSRTGDVEAINTVNNFLPLNIKSFSIHNNTTLQEIKRLIDITIANKGWLVLTYHRVDNSGGEYAVTPEQFEAQLALLSYTNIRHTTVSTFMDIFDPETKD